MILLDQNLSPHLAPRLRDLFPGARHVRDCQLADADDSIIWTDAAAHDLAIVSKDTDFHQRSLLFGAPPKVVWIRRGNCSTSALEQLLRERQQTIYAFLREPIGAFLVIG